MNDLDRARELGMTLDEFQSLVGHCPLDTHPEFIKGGSHSPKDSKEYDSDKDIKLKKKKKESKAEAQDYGLHTHDKSNPLGLHAHYPGGPLSGAHTHTAQNPLGHHTHRYSREELLKFKFARPGIMIDLDGPHNHERYTLEGNHQHDPDLLEPPSGERADEIAARNSQVDKN